VDEDIKEKINNLTNSDLIQNDRLEEAEDRLAQIESLLEGSASDKNDNGLKGDITEAFRRLNKLEAMMAPDSIGEGGIINRLKRLEKQAGLEERVLENHWRFWIALVGLIGVITAAVVPNLDRIEKFMKPRSSFQPIPKKRRAPKVRRIPPPAPEAEPAS
jgi:hypothetical protein